MTVSCVTGLLPEIEYPKRQVPQNLAFLFWATQTAKKRPPAIAGGPSAQSM